MADNGGAGLSKRVSHSEWPLPATWTLPAEKWTLNRAAFMGHSAAIAEPQRGIEPPDLYLFWRRAIHDQGANRALRTADSRVPTVRGRDRSSGVSINKYRLPSYP